MNAYRLLLEKPEGKRPLGRPTRGRQDKMKIELLERGRVRSRLGT
jgi:hypothetical protein